MGIKSTYYITRATALAVLYSKIQESSDDILADMLEDFPESYFKNYSIVSEEYMKSLERTDTTRIIKTINDF